MLRCLLLLLVNLFVMPPLALLGTIITLIDRRTEMVPRVARPWSGLALRACGARVTVTGIERLIAARPAVVVMNHASAVDIYLTCRYMPIPYRMMAKESLFRIPVFGWALSAAGFVPLERAGGRRDVKRIFSVDWGTRHDAVVCFFPEGTRSRDGRLHPFKRGAFVTAIREQVPVVPVALIGTSRVQRAGRSLVHAAPVEFRVLEPISTAGASPADRDAIRDAAWAQIRAALPPEQQPA